MYRHTFLAVLLLLSAVFTVAGEPPIKDAYEATKTCDEFIIGGVGVAGTISGEEVAFRQMLKEPNATAHCQKLLAEGTPAGQLYGLLGLKLLDKAEFEKALPRYADSKKLVKTIAGCMPYTATLAQLAGGIEKGQFK